MVSREEQAELIRAIGREEKGFVSGLFTSAAGIDGNFKIGLPEALKKNQQLLANFAGHMAVELTDVEALASVGGATDIAREVADLTGLPLLELTTRTIRGGVKKFGLPKGNKQILAKEPRIGFIEDVSSTWSTVIRAVQQSHLQGLVHIAVTGWRRGEPAPEGMQIDDIEAYNKKFPFRHLYEYPKDFPVCSVIERTIPLWLPTERMIYARLPELAEAA